MNNYTHVILWPEGSPPEVRPLPKSFASNCGMSALGDGPAGPAVKSFYSPRSLDGHS